MENTAPLPDHLRLATIEDLWDRIHGTKRGNKKLDVQFWSLNSNDQLEEEPYTMTTGTDARKLSDAIVYRRIFVRKEKEE